MEWFGSGAIVVCGVVNGVLLCGVCLYAMDDDRVKIPWFRIFYSIKLE